MNDGTQTVPENLTGPPRGVRWEEQTPSSLQTLRERSGGVCMLPLGCLESHGEHLPLGTDSLRSAALCERAAREEAAAVFPPSFFGTVPGGRYLAGAVAFPLTLLLEVLECTCDEIARNGFGRIILLSSHGGNKALLGLLLDQHLQKHKRYLLYWARSFTTPGLKEELYDSRYFGHACEHETSMALHLHPELVDMKALPGEAALPDPRAKQIEEFETPLSWYTKQPRYLAGDPRPSTAQKGRRMIEDQVRGLAKLIRKVREDRQTPKLQEELYRREIAPA